MVYLCVLYVGCAVPMDEKKRHKHSEVGHNLIREIGWTFKWQRRNEDVNVRQEDWSVISFSRHCQLESNVSSIICTVINMYVK